MQEIEQLKFELQQEKDRNQKLREKLVQKSILEGIGESVAHIAHQLKQPLNGLSILSQRVKKEFLRGSLDIKKLDEIMDKESELIKNMSLIIDDFRELFRVNSEGCKFSLYDSLESLCRLAEIELGKFNIKLVKNYSNLNRVISVFGKRNELIQAMLVIINNSKDAIVANKVMGEITISAFEIDDIVMLSISDNGGGIDCEIIDKIFDSKFSTKSDGMGIGLYLSKSIIENSFGGILSVESFDGNSTFFIQLNRS